MPTRTLPTISKPTPAASARDAVPATPDSLLRHLIALPFPDYVARVALLMSKMGYREVRPLGPLHAKGRNAHGAHDIRAAYDQGAARFTAIAQAKQYRQPVPRCFVDELRGAMLRTGARQGLLFTTSSFAPSAVAAAQAGQHAAPVQLVAGKELARLMIAYGVETGALAPSARAARSEAARPVPAPVGCSRPRRSNRPPAAYPAASCGAGDCPGVCVTVLVGSPDCPRTFLA